MNQFILTFILELNVIFFKKNEYNGKEKFEH